MRRTPLAAVTLAAAALAGCETLPPLETRLQPWVGRSEADLVAAFGVPARTHEAGGLRFLQYEDRRTQIVASDPWFYGRPWWPGYGRFGPVLPPPPSYVVRACSVTFALREGVVEGFSFRGDGCR